MLLIKKIAIVALVVAITASVYFYKEYHRKPADITGIQPAVTVTADTIVAQYENDETAANHNYLGKAIQVQGIVTEITHQHDTSVNVMLGTSGSMHKVSCLLDKRHSGLIDHYKTGGMITIKGICTGFLLDVELNRCVIADKE